MKLKNIKNGNNKNVKTKYTVYFPDQHNFLFRFVIEKIIFRFKSKDHKFLIVTTKDSFPYLGYQQVLKINKNDLPNLINKLINDRLYLQNNYQKFQKTQSGLNPFALLIIIIFIPSIYLYYLISNCFPSPQQYFFPHKFCKVFTSQNFIFNYLIKYGNNEWQAYFQDLTLRKGIINSLPDNSNRYFLDWNYSHGFLYSPLYSDYINNLKANSWDFSVLSKYTPVEKIKYILNLAAPHPFLKINIEFSKVNTSLNKLKIPPGFVMQNLYINNQKPIVGTYRYEDGMLSLDLSKYSNDSLNLEVNLDTLDFKLLNTSGSLLFVLPPEMALSSHTFMLYYPPDKQIVVKQKADIARTGFLQYNLPVRGIYKIDLKL